MLLAFFLLFLLQFTTAEVQSFAVSGSILTFSPGWQSTSSEAAGPFSFTNTLGLALTINLPRGYCFYFMTQFTHRVLQFPRPALAT